MAGASLNATPTKDTVLGKCTNHNNRDIFQTFDINGAIETGMTAQGIIYAGVAGTLASVVPLIANVQVSAAQILSMSAGANSIEVVPAPADPTLFIYPQSFVVEYQAGTVPYTVAGSNAFYLGWGALGVLNSSNALGIFPDNLFIDQTTSQLFVSSCIIQAVSVTGGVPSTGVRGSNFVLQCPDTLSAGNGLLSINISYSLIPLT